MRNLFAMLSLLAAMFAAPAQAQRPSPLQGTWELVAADKLLPDGERVHDYGDAPKGRLIVDAQGRYSLQIFKRERPRFASDDKAAASADEFRLAALGSSTHYGTFDIDAAHAVLVFHIEASSFPNWEGTVQTRSYELRDGVLSYKVPPRADGSVPVSEWRRIE